MPHTWLHAPSHRDTKLHRRQWQYWSLWFVYMGEASRDISRITRLLEAFLHPNLPQTSFFKAVFTTVHPISGKWRGLIRVPLSHLHGQGSRPCFRQSRLIRKIYNTVFLWCPHALEAMIDRFNIADAWAKMASLNSHRQSTIFHQHRSTTRMIIFWSAGLIFTKIIGRVTSCCYKVYHVWKPTFPFFFLRRSLHSWRKSLGRE